MTREEVYKLADEVLANKCKSHVEAARIFATYVKQGQLIDDTLREELMQERAARIADSQNYTKAILLMQERITELERVGAS